MCVVLIGAPEGLRTDWRLNCLPVIYDVAIILPNCRSYSSKSSSVGECEEEEERKRHNDDDDDGNEPRLESWRGVGAIDCPERLVSPV